MFTLVLGGVGLSLIILGMSSYPVFLVGMLLALWALLRLAFRGVDRAHEDRRISDAVRKAIEAERKRRPWQ